MSNEEHGQKTAAALGRRGCGDQSNSAREPAGAEDQESMWYQVSALPSPLKLNEQLTPTVGVQTHCKEGYLGFLKLNFPVNIQKL